MRPAATTEPFAEELRGVVRDLKAQLVERAAELEAFRAEVDSIQNEKTAVQSVRRRLAHV